MDRPDSTREFTPVEIFHQRTCFASRIAASGPDGTVQFTGGGMRAGSPRVRFDLFNTGRREDDLASPEQVPCDWGPGDATSFRKAVFDAIPYDTSLETGYEDNDCRGYLTSEAFVERALAGRGGRA